MFERQVTIYIFERDENEVEYQLFDGDILIQSKIEEIEEICWKPLWALGDKILRSNPETHGYEVQIMNRRHKLTPMEYYELVAGISNSTESFLN